MIFSVSNKESDIKDLLIQLRSDYGDYAFISYIDGEYGTRIWVYNSLVYKFYKTMQQQNTVCIGIVFKNTKTFLTNLCDHIIEIDDVEFYSNSLNSGNVDNSQASHNHYNNVVPSNSYSGNDGWDLVYIRGLESKLYEDVLVEMNFSNIFFTLHVDGSNYINAYGCNTWCLYRINNENTTLDINNGGEIGTMCINSIYICDKPDKINHTNNIAIWIRNSNKWSCRNCQPEYYDALFKYCIINNKKCYVFQDIIHVELPVHSNIIECNNRIKNRPDFDDFIKICSKCDVFIGADSGPYYLLLHQPINIFKICYNNTHYKDNSVIHNIVNKNHLTRILEDFYIL